MRSLAVLALSLACVAGAAAQSSTFLTATRDVFSAVSPSIDPVKALVARTRITMTEVAAAAPARRLNQFFGQGVTYSVVDARRVASFQVRGSAEKAEAFSEDAGALLRHPPLRNPVPEHALLFFHAFFGM